jgi:hypothetical protein
MACTVRRPKQLQHCFVLAEPVGLVAPAVRAIVLVVYVEEAGGVAHGRVVEPVVVIVLALPTQHVG